MSTNQKITIFLFLLFTIPATADDLSAFGAQSAIIFGHYKLDRLASGAQCEWETHIKWEEESFYGQGPFQIIRVQPNPRDWGREYFIGSQCRERRSGDDPIPDVETCHGPVYTNRISEDRQMFEHIETRARKRLNRTAWTLVSRNRLRIEVAVYDRDGLMENIGSRCFYDRIK